MKALPYLCTRCRKVTRHKFARPLRTWVGMARCCGRRARHVFFGRHPLTRRWAR